MDYDALTWVCCVVIEPQPLKFKNLPPQCNTRNKINIISRRFGYIFSTPNVGLSGGFITEQKTGVSKHSTKTHKKQKECQKTHTFDVLH